MKENKAQMRGIKYLWHNLEYILAAVFFVIMLVALFIQVFFRFVLNNPIGWTEELADMHCHDGLYWFNWSHPE